MADTHVETSSDLNQDSLDGAQASVSEVGSAEEFEKENTEDTPSGSHGEADGEAVDGTNGEESREAEDAAVPADATAAAVVTENGAVESEPHVNGNGKCDENTEADSTEVDGSAAEKRKSVVETEALSISPKKARVEGTDEDVIGTEEAALPTNGNHETVA
ncbi:uncharacterized protein LOC116918018 isoform X3 [Daphnia magna]|uniref:Uncharacterized protein n=1 Tax=Daphnia magna TaxID=35525 RepID=A0A162PCM4_9CRUS|nr:uncharacterized protein LOC116918018 isoform X3 [Daphnia magna]KZS18735.1 Uncharacterized protein APZ42_015301 [Daphnia magna]